MKVDLDNCASEPIHIPGHIQPFAALMVVGEDDHRVRWCSDNLDKFLGPPEGDGRSLANWIVNPDAIAALQDELERETTSGVRLNGLYCTAHRSPQGLILEFEQEGVSVADELALMRRLHRVMQRLSGYDEPMQMLRRAAEEVLAVGGLDRTMVYRFDAEMNGEVIIECTNGVEQKYLGQHFPASDIPSQARELYRRNRVRIIPDTSYTPVPVRALNGGHEPLDLSLSVSRAVSPIHIEYLHNLSVGATLTISLLDARGELWGMLVCHQKAPQAFPPAVRLFCSMLAQSVAVQLHLMLSNRESAAEARAVMEVSQRLDGLPDTDQLVAYLEDRLPALLELVDAQALALMLDDKVTVLGDKEVDPQLIQAISDYAISCDGVSSGEPVAHDAIGELAAVGRHAGWVAGFLHIPLGNRGGDCAVFLRGEQVATIDWAGNPNKAVERHPDTGRLSPRKSFDLWRENVRGRCRPWLRPEVRAAAKFAQLAGLHRGYQLRQANELRERMTHMAYHDALTGLPNRPLLLDRLALSLERAFRHGHAVALFFMDLDGFKEVNDRMGHDGGDHVLVAVAQRLLEALRDCDTVARLGGDEFVLVAELHGDGGRPEAEAERIAERIIEIVSAPLELDGVEIKMGASVGVALHGCDAESRVPAEALLHAADGAMYTAKRRGRNGYAFAKSNELG